MRDKTHAGWWVVGCGLLIGVGALPLVSRMTASAQEAIVIDETLASVNKDLITRSMLQRAERALRRDLQEQFPNDPAKQEEVFTRLQPRLLVSLIDERLIAQRAEEMGIMPEIEAQTNATILELCKQNNLENLDACRAAMERQGLSMEDIRASYRGQFLRQAVYGQDVYSVLLEQVTNREAEEYYRTHTADFTEPGELEISEIYIAFTPETQLAAEARARQAYAEIKAGKPFAEVAQKFSDEKRASRAAGGKLPPYKEDQLAAEFKAELDKLKPGEITPILKLEKAYQILRLDARRPPSVKPFVEVRELVKRLIAQRRADAKVKEYLRGLRAKALIRLAEPYRNVLIEAEKAEDAEAAAGEQKKG
ncbi:MAG: peptidyl-prolyl cis-trans isomerase [Chloracidobacterium sp.]|nr:peptidyl-prolyl cis-trans isomerase [Chloracidobacterium sp.]MDW8217079.1 peptidyl-prolyl cis-trans isomerase [Acidobacteriota bacterium]